MSMYFACPSLALLALLLAATAAFSQPITNEQIEYSQNPIPLKMARCYMQPRIALEWSCFRAVEIERSTAAQSTDRCPNPAAAFLAIRRALIQIGH
jgi:hypothetical protein